MDINLLKFDDKGLICAIAQDVMTGQVLMQAYMNREAVDMTLSTGIATYYSRSRQALWIKGQTSGNIQKVVSITADCDYDCLLLEIEQVGVACHTGSMSCFFNEVADFAPKVDYKIVFEVASTINARKTNPKEGSYTNYLFNKGIEKVCKKIGEEATEAVIAAIAGKDDELVGELSDILYHALVLMEMKDIKLNDVFLELMKREGKAPKAKYVILDDDKARNRDIH